MADATITANHDEQIGDDRLVCDILREEIARALPDVTSRIWHAHPVLYLDGNPVVGYIKLKGGIRLLLWSGQSFAHSGLTAKGSFKAA